MAAEIEMMVVKNGIQDRGEVGLVALLVFCMGVGKSCLRA